MTGLDFHSPSIPSTALFATCSRVRQLPLHLVALGAHLCLSVSLPVSAPSPGLGLIILLSENTHAPLLPALGGQLSTRCLGTAGRRTVALTALTMLSPTWWPGAASRMKALCCPLCRGQPPQHLCRTAVKGAEVTPEQSSLGYWLHLNPFLITFHRLLSPVFAKSGQTYREGLRGFQGLPTES